MKKFAKYALLTAGVALFIFLMLPFLEPPSLPQNATEEGQKKSSPQIFTSNPLTNIVNRLARFFTGRSQNSAAVRNETLAQNGSNRAFANEADNTLYAAGHEIAPSQAAAVEPAPGQDPDEANAEFFMQNEDGEWVLVRQRTPETSHAGMHEISVKENAYDRYVKQERLARFSPTSSAAQREEVPESKLARLFNPIKRFFGFGDSAAASGTLQGDALASASARGMGKTDGFGNKANAKNPLQLARAKSLQEELGKMNRQNGTIKPPRLTDLLSTPRTAREAAERVANSKYPNPKTPQEQHAREQIIQEKTDFYAQLKQDRMRKDLLTRSGGDKPTDVLPETVNCTNGMTEGLLTDSGTITCGPNSQKIDDLAKSNKTLFKELTGIELNTNLTPILGVADQESSDKIQPPQNNSELFENEEDKKQAEETYKQEKATYDMYKFMLDKSGCTSSNCFWVVNDAVPNEDPSKENLVNGIEAAGVHFKGDPLNKFAQLKQDFIAAQLAKEPQADDKRKSEIKEDAEKAVPPYLLYNEKDMTQLAQQLREKTDKSNQLNDSYQLAEDIIYFANASDAVPFAEKHSYDTPFFYGKQGHTVLSTAEDGADSIEYRSRQLVEDLAANINVQQEIKSLIHQDSEKEVLDNVLPKAVDDKVKQMIGNSPGASAPAKP